MKKTINVDTMLELVGEFSVYQCLVLMLICIIMFPPSFADVIMYFGALDPTWKCVRNSTTCMLNGTQENINVYRCKIPRSEWEFTEVKSYSIVTQFDFVCDTSWLMYATTSIYFISGMFGSTLIGWASDKYGRKKILFPCAVFILTASFLSAFSPNIYLFILFRTLTGFTSTYYQSFIIISEIVGANYRVMAGIIFGVSYAIALCILGLKAYFIREWKTLFIVCSAPYFITILTYKCIPESIRWQRLNGKTDKALRTIQRMAVVNNRAIPENVMLKPDEDNETKTTAGYLNLFDTKKLATYSLVQGYISFSFSMVYYGLNFAADDLGGDLYGNFVLLSAIEIPAAFIAMFIYEKYGRQRSTIVCTIIAGIALISIGFTTSIARIVVALIGKLFITAAFNGMATWSLEIYPTSIRAKGLSYLGVTATLGAASSPFVAKLFRKIHPSVPFLIFGISSFFIALLSFVLPETKGKPMNEVKHDLVVAETDVILTLRSKT